MSTFLVLTVIADDKPGIVEQLSAVIAEQGGNWLESRMSHMAGKFAGILRVSIDEEKSNTLVSALASLSSSGIVVNAEHSKDAGDTVSSKDLTLNLVGNDRPGIVREVSQTLAKLGVNVLELTTNCESAAMSADPLFRTVAHLRVPQDFESDELTDALEAISNDLMVEINLD
ncbi:glycine cleavage system protein R [Bacterioplanoides sp. SCSIO 12839]|uniref:glycine cleavage system protein R n=1 Tax=Bacterioplanoides sp. SCSIO 12839 TaxID=2829569 RepID=UPI002105B236|nr:ACT domain-containing protein [Bacterioplanoides sp. SCSIO 12839]UTW49367.1 glycine cleavage system protein R [Bacterioplanoides sp. SCSIO 12839]